VETIVNTRRLEKELITRGLLPDRCRLIEVRVEPDSALVVRYEVYVTADKLALYADALKAAATEAIADNERHRRAVEAK